MICNKCNSNELTDVHYQEQKNKTIHLVGTCRLCGFRFIPYIKGLDLEIRPSEKFRKQGNVIGQETLF